jgi:GNAT superfamily N-acetyltransferase
MIQIIHTHEQLVELHGAIKEFYQKMPYAKKALDADVWADKWIGLIENGTGTVIAALKDDKIIGGIGLITFPAFEDDAMTTQEAFWYVQEGHRGAGISLYKAAEEYVRAIGCDRFTMIFLETSMPTKVENFYKKMGFKKAETTYIKEL